MSNRKVQTKTTTVTRTRQNRKRKGSKPVKRNPTPAIHIAPCTRLYAKAITNPFAVQGLPCIPDNIILPSYKFQTKARGVFSTGTLGAGYIVIDPFQMIFNDGTPYQGGDGHGMLGGAIFCTTKAYTNSGIYMWNVLGAALPTGVVVNNSNSLFSTADWNTALFANRNRQYRLVGCGLRVSYIGSNLYNAGRLVIWRNQGNSPIEGEANIVSSSLLQDLYTSITTVSRGSKYVYYVPDDPQFIGYHQADTYSPNISGEHVSHHSMGILIDGGSVDPNQQSWEYEAVAYFEAIGTGFTLSKSEGDPVGHDIVMSSLPNTAPTTSPTQVENSVMSNFLRGFNDTTREVAYNVGKAAIGYAGSLVNNYMNASTRQLYLT